MTDSARRGDAIEIVTIGDELLLGYTIDTNGAHLARELATIGVRVAQRTSVGDEAGEIARVVGAALERTGAVITTGGLGPTSDDLTKQSIAALFGRGLHVDEEHVAWMEQRWRKRFNAPLPASNRNQAMIPDGAEKLTNNHGSAPGIWLQDERGRWVAMLPGVPREMRGMLADTLLPRLRDRYASGRVVRSLTLRTTGVGESLLADRIVAANAEPRGAATLAYLPSIAGVDLRVTVRGIPADEAEAALQSAASSLRSAVGQAIYGEGDDDLAAVVLESMRRRGLSAAVAESCTGGLLGARLTAIPGSSDVMRGGIIAYDNSVKRELLGVEESTLREHGAVSEEVARHMSTAIRGVARANVGLAITGVAGPGGGTPEKPVGTVWIAADVEGRVEARRLNLWGDREEIRQRAAQWTMELLRQSLEPAPTGK